MLYSGWSHHLSMLSWSFRVLTLAVLGASLIGCASAPRKPAALVSPLTGAVDDDLADQSLELADKVDTQNREIEKLNAELEAIRETSSVPKAVFGTPSVPLVKLRPRISDEPEDPFIDEEDETLADSSHENLELYRDALRLKTQGKCDRAQSKLRGFLDGDADHVYADRAEYLIAECYLAEGEFVLAGNAARDLQVRFPHSVRVPDAIVLRARAQAGIGAAKSARVLFRSVLEKFPSTPAAVEASRRLSELHIESKNDSPAPLLLEDLH